MIYIIREYNSMGGGAFGLPFRSWYEYSMATTRPSAKDDFVKVGCSKEELKTLVRQKGGLNQALGYLFDLTVDENLIDDIFDK